MVNYVSPSKQLAQTPKVSIGMPVYNGQLFICEALDSLLAQTHAEFELIISDNASTDRTGEICREYGEKDPRICYVQQTENRGPLANFKFVLDEADGDYFMWMAADDILSDRYYLENLLKKNERDIDYFFPNVSIIDTLGRIQKQNLMSPFVRAKSNFDFARASITVNSYQIYGLFKIEKIREDFKYLEQHKNLACFGEGLFVHAISTARNGRYVPEACKHYRRHEKNISSSIPAIELLSPFCRYSISSIFYFTLSKNLVTVEKIQIITIKILVDFRYLAYLSMAAISQKYPMIKFFKKKLLKALCSYD